MLGVGLHVAVELHARIELDCVQKVGLGPACWRICLEMGLEKSNGASNHKLQIGEQTESPDFGLLLRRIKLNLLLSRTGLFLGLTFYIQIETLTVVFPYDV